MSSAALPFSSRGLRLPRPGPFLSRLAAVLFCAAPPGAASTIATQNRLPDPRRMVHRFDFDERKLGNYEAIPMHWRQVDGPQFPSFAGAAFDPGVGRRAPPSFHLGANGRNVAYWYAGPATTVRPNSEYLIIGWIRPDRLVHARGDLSAYYLDRERLPIEGTQVFGRLVGGETGEQSWRQVEIHLPPAPPAAQTIGLTAWVVQASVWDPQPRPHRHIEPCDIEAGAWFDDITIYRMSSALLSTPAPGNIFVAPETPTLLATVADSFARGLSAELTVLSACGTLVHQSEVPVQTGRTTRPTRIRLGGVEPGLYRAKLTIRAGGEQVLSRRVRFAQLAAPHNRAIGVARPFGLVLDSESRAGPAAESALLAALSVGAVKVPVWARRPHHGLDAGRHHDLLLHELVKARVSLTGVLGAPPAGLVESAGQYARQLLEILSDDPEGWRPYLAALAAPYASVFRTWQIGADDDPGAAVNPALPEVLRRVRREMVSLITTVYLGAPADVTVAPGTEALPAEEITVRIAPDIQSRWIGSYLAEYRNLPYERVSAYVEIGSSAQYARLPGFAEFAKRVIRTRHAGVDTVYVPQLWRTKPTLSGTVCEPSEHFIAYRTIIDLLGDLTPGPEIALAENVVAVAFHDTERSVLAIWDPSAPAEGRVYEFQLGSAEHQVDLWGRAVPLGHSSDGHRQVRLYPEPVFVDGIERWLVEFASALRITPGRSETSLLPRTHTIQLSNAGKRLLAGQVALQTPRNWEVRPRTFGFRLPARSGYEQPVELRFAHNEPAGPKQIRLVIDFETEPSYHLEIPLTLEVGIKDVDVWGFAFLEGDRLVLRHGVTNRSSQPLSFRSFATAPGRSRQFRVIASLAPAESTTAEYRFENAATLAGRTVRLGLREVDGSRQHSLELTAP